MNLLAIDAATEACSVALLCGGDVINRNEIAPRGHAQRLLPMVDEVLAESQLSLTQLDAIAFDQGPGSFTGVRVGTSVTQGLAFGADLPVIPVSSLATLAQGIWQDRGVTQVVSVIDARMEEVYWGYYKQENGIMALQGREQVSRPEAVTPKIEGHWFGAGSGWQVYLEALQATISLPAQGIDGGLFPQAQDILPLAVHYFENGQMLDAHAALPSYLRNEVAHRPARI